MNRPASHLLMSQYVWVRLREQISSALAALIAMA
jgi:hypothetical protein